MVRGWTLLLWLTACHPSETPKPPDAGAVAFQLGLTTRYINPEIALEGLEVFVDGENHPVAGAELAVDARYPSLEAALDASFEVELRLGETVLDRVVQRPGDICAGQRGDDNPLVAETVDLCVRANGELQVNDFSCEHARSGFFTADLFCPTDCHPLLASRTCGEERCGLILSHHTPRYGVLACVPEGRIPAGQSCRPPELGRADACQRGLACVQGVCASFCLDEADCREGERCQSALTNDAEPFVCVDPEAAPAPFLHAN